MFHTSEIHESDKNQTKKKNLHSLLSRFVTLVINVYITLITPQTRLEKFVISQTLKTFKASCRVPISSLRAKTNDVLPFSNFSLGT